MNEEPRRPAHQSADVDQTNDQKVDQANTQDASHHSDTRQDVNASSHVSQADDSQVTVVVQNYLSPAHPESGHLAGRVLDAAGSGISGCMVSVFFGPLAGIPVAVEQTDQLGRFRVADLPPGFYSLRVTGPDGTSVEHWNLRLSPGGECRPQLLLPPAAEGATAWPVPAPPARKADRTPRRSGRIHSRSPAGS
ncbi:MAG TPA: carboxypeptidase-like regulatory domain-containing protein [Symbiobacteriaceae bacterium]